MAFSLSQMDLGLYGQVHVNDGDVSLGHIREVVWIGWSVLTAWVKSGKGEERVENM